MSIKSTSNQSFSSSVTTNATTTYTVMNSDKWVILNNASAVTVTLPAANANLGRELYLKSIGAGVVSSASSNVVPINSATAGTALLSAAGKWAHLVSDGTNWVTFSSN